MAEKLEWLRSYNDTLRRPRLNNSAAASGEFVRPPQPRSYSTISPRPEDLRPPALVERNQIQPATMENVSTFLREQLKPAPAPAPVSLGRVENLDRYLLSSQDFPKPEPAGAVAAPGVAASPAAQAAPAVPPRPRLRTTFFVPGMESTGAAPMQYGGRGYATSSRGTTAPEGLTPEQTNNMQVAGLRRSQLENGTRQIATISPNSDLPTIQGADWQRLQQIRDAVNARPQLDPANVRRALAPQQNEKAAAEAAMGGRTIEDVVASMERRTPRRGLRAAEAAARFEDSMAAQERNAGADRQNRLDIATAQGQAATQEQMQAAFRDGIRARQAAAGGAPENFNAPPASAIARLKALGNDPTADAEFDAVFGPGAAARARGQ